MAKKTKQKKNSIRPEAVAALVPLPIPVDPSKIQPKFVSKGDDFTITPAPAPRK